MYVFLLAGGFLSDLLVKFQCSTFVPLVSDGAAAGLVATGPHKRSLTHLVSKV